MEFLRLVFEQPRRVMAPVVMIGPLFIDVFCREEIRHLMVAGVRARLALAGGHVLLKVAIDYFVGHVPEELDLAVGPLVEIDRLDFGDVYAELTVHATAANANEDAKGDGGPARNLAFTVGAGGIVSAP